MKEDSLKRARLVDEGIQKDLTNRKNWWKKKVLNGIPAEYFIPNNASLITGQIYQEMWEKLV